MRTRTALLAVVLAALVAVTGALATTTAKDPSSMILRKADMPAGADYEPTQGDDLGLGDALDRGGVDTDAASYYGIAYSKAKGSVQLSGVVYVAASPAAATKGFGIAVKDRRRFWRQIGLRPQSIPLPATYGQQQAAMYDPAGAEGIGQVELVVRRGSVVWWMGVKLERRPNVPTKAEIAATVNTYALKQKRRVG